MPMSTAATTRRWARAACASAPSPGARAAVAKSTDFGFWILDFGSASAGKDAKSKIQNPKLRAARPALVALGLSMLLGGCLGLPLPPAPGTPGLASPVPVPTATPAAPATTQLPAATATAQNGQPLPTPPHLK